MSRTAAATGAWCAIGFVLGVSLSAGTAAAVPHHYAFATNNSTADGPENVIIPYDVAIQTQGVDTVLPDPADVWAVVQNHPVGQRAHWIHANFRLLPHPGPDGAFVEHYWKDVLFPTPHLPSGRNSVWFDEWYDEIHDRFDQWYAEYKAIGGEVDMVLIDFESKMHHDVISGRADNANSPEYGLMNDPTLISGWVSALVADPRWPALRDQLNARAIAVGYDPQIVNFNDMSDFGSWQNDESLWPKMFVWNRVMFERTNHGLNHISFEAVWKHFPDVRGSNYGSYYVHNPGPDFRTGGALRDWQNSPVEGVADQHVGTHQVRSYYGWRGIAGRIRIQMLQEQNWGVPVGPAWDWFSPRDDEFDSLVWGLRYTRGMIAERPDVPIQCWVSGDQYTANIWLDQGLRWWNEALFHLVLHDVRDVLYWNTYNTAAGDRNVSDALYELDELVGDDQRSVLILDGPDWDAERYLLSGMRTGERGDVYRFTPRDSDPGSVVNTDPFTFRFDSDQEEVIPVPRGQLYVASNPVTAVGYWIHVPPTASPVEQPGESGEPGASSPPVPVVPRAYPNPARLSSAPAVTFAGLPAGGSVQILTVDGRVIRVLDEISVRGEALWDLRSSSSQSVAPGLYIANVRDRNGQTVRTIRLGLRK